MSIFESDDIAQIEEMENFYNTQHFSESEFLSHAEETHRRIQAIKNRSSNDKNNKSATAEKSKE